MVTIPAPAVPRPCWFVGASYNEADGSYEDQTERFLRDGIWENGYDNKFLDQVRSIRPGDRIAIKSTYKRRHKLPFDYGGKWASVMAIKAVGVVTKNRGDGQIVEVDWTPVVPRREWYFYTYRTTVWEVWPGTGTLPEAADALIKFAFEGATQDYQWFRRFPLWGGITDTSATSEIGDAADDTREEPEPPAYSIDDIIKEGCFLPRERLADILESWRDKQNLILQGPPGTGKTWLARKLAYALIELKDDQLVRGVQFHGNLSYEDFVRGWRPDEDGRLKLVDGPLLRLIDEARSDLNTDYVMLIEEINRGNPAQIFGEMLTLLENGKRNPGEALALSYPRPDRDDERVYVPPNLYVIGTMNLTDRSLALVDFAFRRRFAFEELEPVFGQVWRNWVNQNCGIPADFLAEVERRLTSLNERIAEDGSLGPQFRIGHSFVTPPAGQHIGNPAAWFRRVVDKEIRPLLNDYWFDNPETARQAANALLLNLP